MARIRCTACGAESFNMATTTLYCATCHEALEAKVERLRLLCAHAADIMNNYGNMINWPDNVPQEYAATINKLRRAANIEGAA